MVRTKSEWGETFAHFDANGDGEITPAELQDALAKIGYSLSTAVITSMLREAGGRDGKSLNFSTFMKFIGNSMVRIRRSGLRQMFSAIDLDCSSYLTGAKIRHFMTELGMYGDDNVVEEMIEMYDLDGNGEITFEEFEKIVRRMGYVIVEDEPACDGSEKEEDGVQGDLESKNDAGQDSFISLYDLPLEARSALQHFDLNNSGSVSLGDIKEAANLLHKAKLYNGDPTLHWRLDKPRHGLGTNVVKANHIAIIVSDVGRSARFYSEVMGFQQIRRPNFDKHGAWFTMGNLELHLIKGVPVVHGDEDLIVSHVSIETKDISKVPAKLSELGIPYRQNVSVPKGVDAGKGTNTEQDSDSIVRQYFVRDPDGYYVEICNCQVLTKYCIGEKKDMLGYNEGVNPLSFDKAALTINLMHKWQRGAEQRLHHRHDVMEMVQTRDCSVEEIARLLGCEPAEAANEEKLKNFMIRQTVYGDVCQNECQESLKRVLRAAGNDAALANDIMLIRAELGGRQLRPPAFYEDDGSMTKPEAFAIKCKSTEGNGLSAGFHRNVM